MPLRLDPNNPGPPRGGIPADAWPKVVRLQSEYHDRYDWPDELIRVYHPRLAFTKYLIDKHIIREDR